MNGGAPDLRAAQARPGALRGPLWAAGVLLLAALAAWTLRTARMFPLVSPAESGPAPAATFRATVPAALTPPEASPPGMVWIPGGEFSMGALDPRGLPHGGGRHMDDARPIHRVYVDPFWMDAAEVTNAEYARFVKATGYVTVAERTPSREDFPGAPAENVRAGSVVFAPPAEQVPLDNQHRWWSYVPKACWRRPEGPPSDLRGREDYPVVQVAYEDALAYAEWAGKRLPTEAEWEFAARGGLAGKVYPWGDELTPGGRWAANIYEGRFPIRGADSGEDGYDGMAPVARFAPNAYGLYDMAGNAWEWVSDWYRPDYYASLGGGVTRNP